MSNDDGLEGAWDDEWESMPDDDEEYVQSLLRNQAERIRELRATVKSVRPKMRGRELLDSPLQSIYELSRVSATFPYLRLAFSWEQAPPLMAKTRQTSDLSSPPLDYETRVGRSQTNRPSSRTSPPLPMSTPTCLERQTKS